MINSVVFSKLFYCSAVRAGTYKENIHKLQLMQNFAARIVTDTGKYDHITLALKALGWLADYRGATLVAGRDSDVQMC